MGQYAKLIADLKLVKELRKSDGREDISREDVDKLVALVNEVADVAGPLLERIPSTFKQYTEHNILHCRNLLDLMGRFIPRETLRQLNALELAVLILSALLHDFGMFVSEREKREALKSAEFDSFLAGHHDRATALEEARRNGDHERAEIIQDALLAEYFRRLHPERARVNVRQNLAGKLVFRDVDISDYVLDVCESHAWGVHESNDPQHPHKAVNRLSTNKAVYGVSHNLQYAACCLRLADIMDFDRSRTPLVVFQNIDFTEAKSWEEWNKHLSIKGWVVKDNDVIFRAECKKPAYYVAVMEFLDWVDYELGECRRLVTKEAPADIAARYKLHLPPVVDRTQVEMEDKSYLAGAFRFQLEYDRIMKLLMDKSLYPDPSLFLRELLQNSLDACRNREAHAKEAGAENSYTPRIVVSDYSDDPDDPRIIFQDNGMGMSRRIVENYFMRVGRSYYRSPEFDAERARLKKKGIDLEATSRFGIGILSCFMVADRFEVETYRVGSNPVHITIEGPTKYFTIKLLPEPPRADFQPPPASDLEDGPPNRRGTRVTVHLRGEISVKVLETLNTFSSNTEFGISIYDSNDLSAQVISPYKWKQKPLYLNALTASIRSTPFIRRTGRDVATDLDEILVPSAIPLSQYNLSPKFLGNAWLWLLRGVTGPCPQRGYLKISSSGLEVRGLPVHVDGLRRLLTLQTKAKATRAIQLLEEVLHKRLKVTSNTMEYEKLLELFDDASRYIVIRLIKAWGHFLPHEQKEFYEAIRLRAKTDIRWYDTTKEIKALYNGSVEVVRQPLIFSYPIRFKTDPYNVALHGIFIPAGLLSWNPMDGSSTRLELLSVPGGAQLDVRGHAAPIPSASRLFVDDNEARKVLVPFTRLVLKHSIELAAIHKSAAGWNEWINDLLESVTGITFWQKAVEEESALLQKHLKYTVTTDNDDIEYLSHQEVIRKFGRWVPVSGSKYASNRYEYRHGLKITTGTGILLATKVVRQLEDGFWEVDMESDIPIREGRLEESLSNRWRMQHIST